MAVFRLILIVVEIFVGIYVYYYIRRTMEFYGMDVRKIPFKISAVVLAVFIALACRNMWSVRTVIILHLLAFALLFDVIALFTKVICHNRQPGKLYRFGRRLYGCGLLPIAAAALLLIYGFFNMNHVIKTEYLLETEKNLGNYKVVLITDTHYGTIQDTEVLKNKIEEINMQNPDIVVLGGDIVEEGTSKEQMQEVFQVLGGITNHYGIYYVYGNHDRQPYTQNRSFTNEELEHAITENGIVILEDDYVEIRDDLVIAGRGDAAWGNVSGRASTEEILDGIDREKYIILADHQPVEAEENSEQGVDLEISGHTHAGQVWPVGVLSELAGILNYGEYQEGACKVIVSSGFTGWGYPIRTEEHCEYVVINIESAGTM
jgi:predicted MPP superfamily phosphohydrolase